MTVGELAQLYNDERQIGADLEVVKVEGWRRSQFFDETSLTWINPSPNIRSLTQTLLSPGIGLLETTNLSVGRGTDSPFEWIGAPWLDGAKLAEALARQSLPGIRIVPTERTPASSTFANQRCGGLQLFVTDRSKFEPLRLGLAIACELHRLYPSQWKVDRFDDLLRHRETYDGLKAGRSVDDLLAQWKPDVEAFRLRREKHLLYP
jgi:uncharacterized protein YbbC (DUF1343 family)